MRDKDRETLRHELARRMRTLPQVEYVKNLQDLGLPGVDQAEFRFSSNYDLLQWHLSNTKDDERMLELYESLTGGSFPQTPEPWAPRRFPLFLSHVHTIKGELAQLKEALAPYGIDAFLAHEAIAPTSEWEEVIRRALKTAKACAAFLTPDFHASKWTDQEIGFCLGRDLLVLSVDVGAVPYGFIGRYQALPRKNELIEQGEAIFTALLNNVTTRDAMRHALMHRFEDATSFDDANRLCALLLRVESWTSDELDSFEVVAELNPQVRGSFSWRNTYGALMSRHS